VENRLQVLKHGICEEHWRRHWFGYVLGGLLIYVYALCLLRHFCFASNIYDFGMFEQVIWNIGRGAGDFSPFIEKRFIAHHFMPVLYLLGGCSAVSLRGPVFLYALQAGAYVGSGWVLYQIGWQVFGVRRQQAAMMALVFLVTPGVSNAVLYDFHPEVLGMVIFPAMFYAACRRKFVWMAILLVLGLSLKENAPVIVLMLGCILLARRGDRKSGYALLAVGGASLLVYLLLARHFGFGQDFVSRYSWLGATPSAMPRTLVMRPWFVATTLAGNGSVAYLCALLACTLGLCLLRPLYLLPALPAIALNCLASYGLGREFKFYYQGEIIPWLFVALMAWWGGRDGAWRWRKILLWALVVTNVGLLYAKGCLLPGCRRFGRLGIQWVRLADYRALREFTMQKIGNEASLAITGNMPFGFLLHRDDVRMLPVDSAYRPDYVIVDSRNPHWEKGARKQINRDLKQMRAQGYRIIEKLGTGIEIDQLQTAGQEAKVRPSD
jgi:uncharacterized membrane protein